MLESINNDKDVFLEIDEFVTYLLDQYDTSDLRDNRISLERELTKARIESEKIQNELIAYNDKNLIFSKIISMLKMIIMPTFKILSSYY